MSTRSRAARVWQQIRTAPQLGRNIVVVIVMIVVGVTCSSLVLAQMTFIAPWADREEFSIEFADAPAVNPDSTHVVTIAGVEVGNIVDWRVTESGLALIDVSLESGTVVHDNARAVVRSVNPLNEVYIEIDPGGSPGRPLEDGAVLPVSQTSAPVQADEVLAHLDERQQEALTALLVESDVALARFPETLPEGLRATDSTLGDLQPVVDALQTRRESIAQLVTALGRISTAVGGNNERTVRLVEATQTTLGALAATDDEISAALGELPGLNDGLREAFTATQGLTEQLDPTLDNLQSAAEDLPPTLERVGSALDELQDTAVAARPVVEVARPVVADLRPLVADVDASLDDLLPVTANLERDTGILVPHLDDLQAFVYHTSSVFSVRDGRGNFVRGHLVVPLPDGNALPGGRGGYAPGPENGLDPSSQEGN